MSRETDSSSSGPEGRGGGAYPSGTPPYGPPQYPTQDAASYDGLGASDASAPEPGSPRTETQLTTRIRINIPGSRPIPPVVVRKPVDGEAETTARHDDSSTTAERPSPAAPQGPTPGPASGPAPETPTEDPGDRGNRTSSWFAPRKAPAPPPAEAAPALEQSPRPSAPGPAGGAGGQRSGLPYFSGGAGAPSPAPGRDDRQDAPGGTGHGTGDEPSGPTTTGPGSGETPGMLPGESLLPPAFQRGFNSRPAADKAPESASPAEAPASEKAAESPAPPRDGRPGQPGEHRPGPLGERRTPDAGAGTTGLGRGDLSGPGRSEETGSEPSGPHVSGDTLVSGVPVVPQNGNRGHRSGSAARRSGAGRPGAEKKRSKVVLVGAALVGVLGIAYGAGLLLDHADVPNGTTALGVEIGGMSEAAAAQKLANSIGSRTESPLTITVNGEQQQLQPKKAGLGVQAEATVRRAVGRDYNPVTVIGSLFGATHEADPVFKVDQEKLAAALKTVSGEASGALDGTIRFLPGRAVPVVGKPHEALDIDKAVPAVSAAFRKRAVTGEAGAVEVPSSMQQPAVSKAEIQRKMQTFARPAMSGLVTIKAGKGVIQFGPDKSLPKILSMRVVDGKLVEHYNLRAVKLLYGSTFDGVLIRRGNGSRTPVTPQDVVNAMGPALLKTDPAQRIGVIPLNGN